MSGSTSDEREVDRAFESLAAMLEDAAAHPPILASVDALHVTRTDWLHGLTRCPGCALSLDAEKDLEKKLYTGLPMEWTGVEGVHRRCGRAFRFEFGKPVKP